MAEIQTEYCVEIRVPTRDGEYAFGSGYTLGPHWVITAYHVLFSKEVDKSVPFKITWWDETSEEVKRERDVGRKHIVWFHEQHDIALICCKLPYKNAPKPWEVIDKEKPRQRAECECAGFLANLCNEEGNQRRKEPKGTLGRYSPEQSKVDINDLKPSVRKDKYWAGFSGSPVFADGKLTAVVRTVNIGERGASLTASFIAPALDAKGGRKQMPLRNIPGFLETPERLCWKRVRPDVVAVLEQNTKVSEALSEDYQESVKKGLVIKSVTELVDGLRGASERMVVQCFLRVSRKMHERQDRDAIVCLEYLARVWLVLMAARYGSISGVDIYKNDAAAGLISVKAVDPVHVDVEAQAANGENRKIELWLKGEHLRSPFDLTPGHKAGLDPNDKWAAGDVLKAYEWKTRPGLEVFSAADVWGELEGFVTRPESGCSTLPVGDDVKRGKEISDQLELDCLELGGRMYIRLPEADGSTSHSELRKLPGKCPQLLVFEVSMTGDSERKRCQTGLHRIIYNARKFLADQNKA